MRIKTSIFLLLVFILTIISLKEASAKVGEPCCPTGGVIWWYYDISTDSCKNEVGGTQPISCNPATEKCQFGPPGLSGTCISKIPGTPTPPGITCGRIGMPCCPGASAIERRTCLSGVPSDAFDSSCICLQPTPIPPGYSSPAINFPKLLEEIPNFKFADATLGKVISALLPYIFAISGLILFVLLIIGGFELLTSGGNPETVKKAQGRITSALVGFLIIFLAYWLTQILEVIFGIQIF